MSKQPYIGLRPFELNETDIFFGREEHAYELISRLNSKHFLAVMGSSGCGKSSLVKTKLIDKLKSGYLPKTGTHWIIIEVRPGQQPFKALADKLFSKLKDILEPIYYSSENLQQFLRQDSLSLHKLLAEYPLLDNAKLLIICDQFEEFFRYFKEKETAEARNFVSLLLSSSKSYPISPTQLSDSVYVVITMRSDFLGDCAKFEGLAEAINQGLYLTPRLNESQLRAAIEDPVLMFNGKIDSALVTQLLEDAENNQDQLPLLQHVLMRLWILATNENRNPIHITLDDYIALQNHKNLKGYEDRKIKGLGKVLSIHADEIFKNLTLKQQQLAEILFRSLCEVRTEKLDTRRPVKLEEVIALTKAKKIAGQLSENIQQDLIEVIEFFQQEGCNFLTLSDKELNKETIIDISHESLIRQWQCLQDWIKQEAKAAEIYQRLLDGAVRYKSKETTTLLQSDELKSILKWWYKDFKPTEIWAKRYGGNFELTESFLNKSWRRKIFVTFSFSSILLIVVFFLGQRILYNLNSNSDALNKTAETIHYYFPRLTNIFKEKISQKEKQDLVMNVQEKIKSDFEIEIKNTIENSNIATRDKEKISIKLDNALKQETQININDYNTIPKDDPDDKLSLYRLGVTSKNTNNIDDAVWYFNKYLSLKGNNKTKWNYYDIWANYYLGDIYYKKRDFKNAIKFYNKVTKLNPNHDSASYKLGKAYLEAKNYVKAVELFNTHITISSNPGYGYYYLGRTLEKQKKYNEAINAYEKAAESNSDIDVIKELRELKNR
jgi:tetratricopeptide (TPR) repeat protein